MKIQDIIPGVAYGLNTTIFGHPFDTIKTRLQSGMYTNTFQCIIKTISNEGIKGFYRGASVPTFSHVFKRGYQFPVFHYLTDENKMNPHLAGLICGSSGTIFGNPLQVIKVNTQSTTNSKYINAFNFIYKHHKIYGIKGFYRGFKINCLKDGLFASCFLGNYTIMKLYLENTWYNNFLAGGMCNVIAWSFLIPFDYIKTQIQFDNGTNNNKNIISILSDIHKTKQYKVLWRGIIPTLIRVFPVSGLSMMIYEFLKLCKLHINI